MHRCLLLQVRHEVCVCVCVCVCVRVCVCGWVGGWGVRSPGVGGGLVVVWVVCVRVVHVDIIVAVWFACVSSVRLRQGRCKRRAPSGQRRWFDRVCHLTPCNARRGVSVDRSL